MPLMRRSPATFRRRLAVSMTVLAVAVLAAASVIAYASVSYTLRRSLDRTLLGIARAELASAIDDPHLGVHVHDDLPASIDLPIGAGYERFAEIKDAYGKILAQTRNLTAGPEFRFDRKQELHALAGFPSFATVQRGQERYRAVYHPLQDNKTGRLSAVVAIPERHLRRSLQILLLTLTFCLCGGVLGAAWGSVHLARYLTRPLEEIAATAGAVGEQHLDARIPARPKDSELAHVVDALNDMLDRIENAFAAQRRLVADASHELRTPLSNLRGNIEVTLRRPRSTEEYGETLVSALQEIERLTRLVDGLLTLSRADTGQLNVQLKPCDLSDVARDAVAACAPRASQKRVHVELNVPHSAPVQGDVDRLRQVVDNLLDNAVRHAPPDTTVRVSTQQADHESQLVVRDAGPGLTEEQQIHVFERFYRADSARARSSGGTGLGLAISKAIMDAHGGRIAVTSAPGAGTAFKIALRAAALPNS